jgi:acid phosphatase (class A)
MKLSSLFLGAVAIVFVNGASANPFNSPVFFQARANVIAVAIEPPPVRGSELDVADFKELHYWQDNRTSAQCKDAAKEVRMILRTFVGSRSDLLSPKEEIKLTTAISLLQLKVAAVTLEAKHRFNRPRPFLADPTLKPCIAHENMAASYPSGHASSAYAIAEALSSLFPNRADLFLDRAQEISFHRLLGGVHHRTDLIAGEKIGRYYGRRSNFSFLF